jgi:hypothetical protein
MITYEEACETLHLTPGAPVEAAEAVYRVLSKTNHPDLGGSTVRMARINSAIDVIRVSPPRVVPRPPDPTCRKGRVDTIRMPWGKFRGIAMNEVPHSYLVWLIENTDDASVKNHAAKVLHVWASGQEAGW